MVVGLGLAQFFYAIIPCSSILHVWWHSLVKCNPKPKLWGALVEWLCIRALELAISFHEFFRSTCWYYDIVALKLNSESWNLLWCDEMLQHVNSNCKHGEMRYSKKLVLEMWTTCPKNWWNAQAYHNLWHKNCVQLIWLEPNSSVRISTYLTLQLPIKQKLDIELLVKRNPKP